MACRSMPGGAARCRAQDPKCPAGDPSRLERARHRLPLSRRHYQRRLDAHHVAHWADGGETKLSNLLMQCRWHHRLVHEGGIVVEPRAAGGWRFLRPDGREFDRIHAAEPPPYSWSDLQEAHDAQGIHIDSRTAATRWRRERPR
jgi:hypothetical protein